MKEFFSFEVTESKGLKFAPGKARLNEKCNNGRTWNQSNAAVREFYAF